MMWKCANFEFDSTRPVVMGILNVTPDSFSDGGQHNGFAEAVAYARQMVDEGAQIIDVGGESTRPGSAEVSVEGGARARARCSAPAGRFGLVREHRYAPRRRLLARALKPARQSSMTLTGFRDPAMVEVAKNCDAGLVVMHMLGEPATMQNDPHYDDVVAEVKEYLGGQAAMLEAAGIARERICVDPGPGFGKTASQTMELMRNFHEFNRLGYPTMVAVSRKSYIGSAYGISEPAQRDEASAQEALMACELGASVVRAHNVPETMKALKNLRPYVILGLGSNVALVANPGEETEGKIANLEQAITGLCSIPDTQIIDISSYYESEPAYYEDQDTFVNAVVLARTGVPPKELLKYLHAIENSLGRTREIENGPRTLDLDIVDYQMYVGQTDELTLPHPRVCERDFVVKPLLELLPNHVLADGTPVVADGAVYGKATKL